MTLTELRQQIEDEYRQRTPKSQANFERAKAVLPDGDTRTGTVFSPHPSYIEQAVGCYLYDADGHEILDFTNNATTLIHGYAHPEITRAIQQQAAAGTAWAAPNMRQVQLAELLCERTPSLQRLRFCNSGTEANMHAIKVARAFTGKDKVLKMDTAYHGTYEGTEFSANGYRGGDAPVTPSVAGIPTNDAANVLVAPYNDLDAAEQQLTQHQDNLAAIIVNPILTSGGVTLAADGYLAGLREMTAASGVVLIFDEVISYRVGEGGAQSAYNVVPDLTTMGKIIGGGLPVGAFGGRADIMAQYESDHAKMSHAGTFNGNPMTMTAGLTAMTMLTAEAYAHLAGLGHLLQTRMTEINHEFGDCFEVNGVTSLVSFTLPPAADREAENAAEIMRLLHLALLNRDIKGTGIFSVSTVMSEAEIERLAGTLSQVLGAFRAVLVSSQ